MQESAHTYRQVERLMMRYRFVYKLEYLNPRCGVIGQPLFGAIDKISGDVWYHLISLLRIQVMVCNQEYEVLGAKRAKGPDGALFRAGELVPERSDRD